MKCIKRAPRIVSKKIMNRVDLMMKFLLFFIFFRFISKPMTKRRKYIPSWERNPNVWEDVIISNGFEIERTVPIRNAEKIHGTLIFSRMFPMSRVRMNAMARNRNMVTIFVFRGGWVI